MPVWAARFGETVRSGAQSNPFQKGGVLETVS